MDAHATARIADDRRERIAAQAKAGLSAAQLSARFGVSDATARRISREAQAARPAAGATSPAIAPSGGS
jgi:ribosome-binding protein aMBF1 (putative translation factor)